MSVGGTANGASAVDACVIRAGCSMRLSTPPRLSASFQICVRATRSTASCSSSRRNETIPPKFRICRAATAWPGCEGRPGYRTRETRGCRSRNAATALAFAQWRSMRTASVFTPRSTSHASNGPGTAPSDFCRNASCAAMASSFVATKPPITSEWPPRYFVVEWRTASAPRASGCWRYGVANVLSTTTCAPTACAASDAAAMSTMLSAGFVGVSSQTSFVRSSRCSASPVEISSAVRNVNR